MQPTESIQHVNIIRHLVQEDEEFPNNGLLPLLVYQKAIHPSGTTEKEVKDLFETNDWINSWVNGVFDYHHYHGTAHEVLGIIRGSARIQFGGASGIGILVETGDVVVIPAGVAHKAIEIFDSFQCVGAYPSGQSVNILTGKPGEKEAALKTIKELELPIADPVYGTDGPLLVNWKF